MFENIYMYICWQRALTNVFWRHYKANTFSNTEEEKRTDGFLSCTYWIFLLFNFQLDILY
jgi:hypothetical protein